MITGNKIEYSREYRDTRQSESKSETTMTKNSVMDLNLSDTYGRKERRALSVK